MRLVPPERVPFATAQGASGARLVAINAWPAGTVQVSARRRFQRGTVAGHDRHDFQTTDAVRRQNEAVSTLAAEIARSVQANLIASAVVDGAFVFVQALLVIPG